MVINLRRRALFAVLAVSVVSVGATACGGGNSSSTTSGSNASIQSNPDNAKVTLTVGSKNFTEEYVLGEIYAQALEAAGYKVKKQLNLGSETVALKALKTGNISGYPEYTSTALQSFFSVKPQDIRRDVLRLDAEERLQ